MRVKVCVHAGGVGVYVDGQTIHLRTWVRDAACIVNQRHVVALK